MDRLRVIIRGRVQGVGFRYSTCRQAEALNLSGWVKNRYDGAVEAEFEGPKAALDQMLAWCEAGPRFAEVSHVESTWLTGEAKYRGFQITG
ncbi:MAG: acylphosphatase [Candidatus Hydrogenedentota bacterium]